MNEHGIRLLAAELGEKIRRKTADSLTDKMHVHVKGMPRKQEIEELQKSEEFREALARKLSVDKLYQDCITINLQPGSLLVARYREDEEAFDAVADNCTRRIISAARKYTAKKEREFLERYDVDELISEVKGTVRAEIIRNLKYHLLNDRLRIGYEAVSPDNFEDFEEWIADMDEYEFLHFAGFDEGNAGMLYSSAILEKHGEIAALKVVEPEDVWNEELYFSGERLFREIRKHFSGQRLFGLVSRNRYLKKSFEARRMLRAEVLDHVPERMPDLFPEARNMERRFIVHIGPTNSGKTYASVERLKTAEHGIYLGPLRLLAFEQYQKLNEQGYPCSLYTGEEHQLVPGSRIQASTIEMADEFENYDIAVIDEAQMVADKERGWAWTTAILGLRADEIHVCIAPYAEKIITDLIEECGDSYEIIRHERQTPLVMDKPKFKLFREYIHKHDALIVFSRRNVHAVAGELRAMGIRCSVIYGNLPYDVRQEEARRFRDGETDVVVATDAIGMGMNLPIERLVFLEISKFDGTDTRLLNAAEIQQIAGRAGRRGLYEKGLWNALEGKEIIASAVDLEIPQIEAVYAGFPESLITIEGKLSGIISEWRNIEPPEGYIISALEHEYELCTYLEERTDDKRLIYRLITIPFDEEDKELRLLWNRLAATVLSGNPVKLAGMMLELPYGSMSLTAAEKLYKEYDLAYAFIEKFGDKAESETVLQYKKELSEIIAEILKTSKLPFKTCRYCGRKLRWNYPFGICAECHSRRR